MRIRLRLAVRGLTVLASIATAAPVNGQLPRALSDSAFASLVARFSEPAGYFDTDNLISNEDSYLHPLTTIRRIGTFGGVYVGVGPDQNFSYIAAMRPRAAVIIDIRRDNLLEHLLFKSIFALSRNRQDYLALLFGKPVPVDTTGAGARYVDTLLTAVTRAQADAKDLERTKTRIVAELRRSGIPLTEADLATIRRFHEAFISEGPALRFTSYGRAPADGYPDFAQLATERDRDGRQRSFLASETDFQYVKSLEDRNLIIPVVGNFAGPRAFAAVAEWMKSDGERLSALYASNVEQYLLRDGLFAAFAQNLERLPRDSKSIVIRSCFNFCRGGHEAGVNGYYSVQMVQLVDTLATLRAAGRINTYYDLVSLGLIRP